MHEDLSNALINQSIGSPVYAKGLTDQALLGPKAKQKSSSGVRESLLVS